MERHIGVIFLSMMMGSNLAHAGLELQVEPTLVSNVSTQNPQTVKAELKKKKNTPDNRPTVEPDPLRPDLPPPSLDPDIVHEPPPVPNPEAVIPPPRLDPEMTVNPERLPAYPEFPHDEPESSDPDVTPPN